MKPFNLQEALAGKPVVDRTGEPVTDFHYFKFYADGDVASNDLFMASEKKEGWINVYPHPNGEIKDRHMGAVHKTKEKADLYQLSDPKRVACVRIEWEE